MKLKAFFGAVMVSTMLFSYAPVLSAETTSATASSQVQSLLEQIKALMAQIETLKAAQAQVQQAQNNVSQTLKLVRNLRQGMSGDDVKSLQTILAADSTIYPEGTISGFYGKLTAEAVKRFQKKNGIETLGFVGPKTLERLNREMENLNLSSENDANDDDNDGNRNENKLCVRVAPGHLIAPGWLKKNDDEKPKVPECQQLPIGIENKLNGTTRTTTVSTTPDTTAPIISNVLASSTLATSTKISWTTNEITKGIVYYSTTSPLIINSAIPIEKSEDYKLNHEVTLDELATSTTYYLVITGTDLVGNTSTTSQSSFITPSI